MLKNIRKIGNDFGIYIYDFDIKNINALNEKCINEIKNLLYKYGIVIFKNQGIISGDVQVEISKKFGNLKSTFYKHPKSPHEHIFRVSNNEDEGCVQVGRSGWHIDGTFLNEPFRFQTMHFHQVCEGGDTYFIPLDQFLRLQDEETINQWNQLYMITKYGEVEHPLIYKHPYRDANTMCFHCGPPFCVGFRNIQTNHIIKPDIIQTELTNKLNLALDQIGIRQKWELGDFAILDNLGCAHFAAEGTQNNHQQYGLRILHRTTIEGLVKPSK